MEVGFEPGKRKITDERNGRRSKMEKKSIREIISVVFKSLTLAMGVAVVALSCMGGLEVKTAITMLGIGLASTGIVMLEKK